MTNSNGNGNGNPRVASARWGLLRAALKGIPPKESDQSASIHRFPGFQLLTRAVVIDDDGEDAFVQRLMQQDSNEIESLLWALHCCCSNASHGMTITLPQYQHDVSLDIRAKLAAKGMLCRFDQQEKLRVWLPPNTDYICVDYSVPNNDISLTVRVRERLPSPKMKLQALTSQQHHDGVDNTGNTRVWDSETTLAYLLLQDSSTILSTLNITSLWQLSMDETTPLQVLELGCGMAGLAGLFLATMYPNRTRVVLTDGHPDAVQNNLINIQLNRAMNHLNDMHKDNITVQRLVWSTDNNASVEQDSHFDLILASDCTHFEEFHASLALTIADNLRVGGVAVLLQPPRGKSLEKFVKCVESCNDLIDIHWSEKDYSDTLTRLYQHYKEDPSFDSNIHYPHLLILRKLRNVVEEDRQVMLKHMDQRELK